MKLRYQIITSLAILAMIGTTTGCIAGSGGDQDTESKLVISQTEEQTKDPRVESVNEIGWYVYGPDDITVTTNKS